MATGIVAGAALGSLMSVAYEYLQKAANSATSRSILLLHKICSNLQNDLQIYHPYFKQVFDSIDQRMSSAPLSRAFEMEQDLLAFKKKLENGAVLLQECERLTIFHPMQRIRLGKKVLRLREEIRKIMQDNRFAIIGMAHIQERLAKSDEEDKVLLGNLREDIDQVKAWIQKGMKLGIDPNANAMIVNQMRTLTTTATMISVAASSAYASSAAAPPASTAVVSSVATMHMAPNQRPTNEMNTPLLPRFVVGLEDPIRELRSMLLCAGEKAAITIVGGMGGIGKTTLAMALCRDQQVREFFQQQIFFITVSQSPDMVAIFSTIWKEVTGEKVSGPPFQNVEDAYRRLQCKLAERYSSSSKCLLVLDDVWSKQDLTTLLFDIPGFQTLVTTRKATKLQTIESQTYVLGLLNEENARRLFCYWTFGQEDLPTWAPDETLVEEVLSECKRLPLALKVIGGSLSSMARCSLAWRRTRDRLKWQGQNKHDELFSRLRTSVDDLDEQLRTCFMDLGAFPEDARIPIDNLLDIWVHVRGMDWDDACCALIELASRCLLTLDMPVDEPSVDFPHLAIGNHNLINVKKNYTCKYGYGGSLVFSQHDVMRDLAIQLGRENSSGVEQWRWLLMPQQQSNIPQQWKSARSLAAQVISINTGTMTAQDWPPLDFPHAEALLLYSDGAEYELPPFIRSMPKLKVLVVTYSGRGALRAPLHGLHSLQSLYINGGLMDRFMEISPDADDSLARHWLSSASMGVSGAGDDSTNCNVNWTQYSMPELKKMIIVGESSMTQRRRSRPNLVILPSLEILKLENMILPYYEILRQPLESLQVLDIQCPQREMEFCNDVFKSEPLRCINLSVLPSSMKTLPASISELKNLEVLQIGDCNELEELPGELGSHLPALSRLVLENCGNLCKLPDTMLQLRNLRLLFLSRLTRLTSLPQHIGQLQGLREIVLTIALKVEALPESLVELRHLEKLVLVWCKSLTRLPSGMGKLQSLKYLSLTVAFKLEELPESLVECGQLETLDLSHCLSLTHLPSGIGQLEHLTSLNLWGASKLEVLPESLVDCRHLETLDLSCCKSLTRLPPGIRQLPSLKALHIEGASELETTIQTISQKHKPFKAINVFSTICDVIIT